jgi:hypothetical protein
MTNQFYKSPYTFINANISQTGTVPAPQLSVLVSSQRGTPTSDTLGVLDIPLYRPFQIPARYLASPSQLLSYLDTLGATINTGISNTINLAAPDSASVVGSTTVLTWDSEPIGWSNISGISLTGTVSQTQAGPTTATGTVLSVSLSGYTITLSSVTGTFNNTDVVSIAYVNNSVSLPDGRNTEKFVMDLYYAVSAMQLQNTLNLTFGTPNLSVTLVSDRDSAFAPNPASVSIGIPDTVTVNGDGTVSLFYNTQPSNWIYVPNTALGTTAFNQATSLATGVLIQQLSPEYTPTGTGFGILVGNVTGTFNTTNAVSMVLDDTQSVFDLLGNNYYKFVSVNPQIATNTDYNTTYLEFQEYINSTNAQQAADVGIFGTLGVFAATSVNFSNYTSLVQPNNKNFVPVLYYYPNRIGDVYLQAGQVAAATAAWMACNLPPYNPMDGIVVPGLPVSADASTYIDVGTSSTAEQVLQWGWNPIAVNSSGQAYMVEPITSQITIPGSSIQDQEFYDVATWQVVDECKYRLNAAVKSPQFLNTRITPLLEKQLENAAFATLKQMEIEGMLINVDQWKSAIIVQLDDVNPHAVDINVTIQIAPAYTQTIIDINLVSALITPPGTQA